MPDRIRKFQTITHTLVKKVTHLDEIYDKSIEKSQQKHHAEIKKQKSRRKCDKLEETKSLVNEKIIRNAVEASNEVGTSSWLTT